MNNKISVIRVQKYKKYPVLPSDTGCFLPTIEKDLPPIILRTHGKVNPIGGAALLMNQFIEVALGSIRDVEQDASHADHLLRAITLDIHRTARQMIRTFSPSTKAIDLLRAIPARDDDGNIAILIAVKRILAIAEILQPILTKILQVLNRHMTRDIPVTRVITRLS